MRAARGQPPRAPRTLPRGDLSEMMEDSYVETKVEALQDNRVKVTVTVDAKDIDARIKKTCLLYTSIKSPLLYQLS